MNYGTHLSAGGVLASMRRMDVIANNLANANTVGFKPDLLLASERPPERLEGLSPLSDPLAPPQAVLEKLGGGIRFEKDQIDFRQGSLEYTGLPSDLAIRGEGFFAVAGEGDKVSDGKVVSLTRAGDFRLDLDGTLRMAGTGRALLDDNGQLLRINPAQDFAVDRMGNIYQNETLIARIQFVRALDPTTIQKVGTNVFETTGGVAPIDDSSSTVEQQMIEHSAADSILSMVELMRESRFLEANVRMMQYQDTLTGQAITGITKIA